jgi:hypothetical protein
MAIASGHSRDALRDIDPHDRLAYRLGPALEPARLFVVTRLIRKKACI